MRDILLRVSAALGLAVVLAAWSGGRAAGPTVRPSSRPATQVVIVGVRGVAQFRQGEGQAWETCKEGVKLAGDSEIRVGVRSAVVLEGDGRKVTVDRLGVFKVWQVMRDGGPATTRGGGRIRYELEIQNLVGVEHESTIRSATTTLRPRVRMAATTLRVRR